MNQSQKTKGIPENLRQPIQNYSMDKKPLGIIWFGGVMTSNLKKKKIHRMTEGNTYLTSMVSQLGSFLDKTMSL